jgi:hypothetical protein
LALRVDRLRCCSACTSTMKFLRLCSLFVGQQWSPRNSARWRHNSKKPQTFTNNNSHCRNKTSLAINSPVQVDTTDRSRRNAGADDGGQRERVSLSAGRESVEQQVERGVGHGAAAASADVLRCRPPGGRCFRRRRLLLLVARTGSQQLAPVSGSGHRSRPPRTLHRRGELADAVLEN